jgi:hypothetical protein
LVGRYWRFAAVDPLLTFRYASTVMASGQEGVKMVWTKSSGSVPRESRFAEARASQNKRGALDNCKAARTVASHANDAADCASLLEMLGLDANQGKARPVK